VSIYPQHVATPTRGTFSHHVRSLSSYS